MVGLLTSWGFPLWINSEWAGIMIHGAWLLKRAEEEAGKGGIPLSSLCNLPNLPWAANGWAFNGWYRSPS